MKSTVTGIELDTETVSCPALEPVWRGDNYVLNNRPHSAAQTLPIGCRRCEKAKRCRTTRALDRAEAGGVGFDLDGSGGCAAEGHFLKSEG